MSAHLQADGKAGRVTELALYNRGHLGRRNLAWIGAAPRDF
jgi:hypothetical protein